MSFLEKLKKIRNILLESEQPGHLMDEMMNATIILEKPEEITEEERRILEGITVEETQLKLQKNNRKIN